MILQFPSSAGNFSTCWLFIHVLLSGFLMFLLVDIKSCFPGYTCMIFVVHLEEEKVPGHGVVDTCSLAGLFPGVRRSSVSFVFSFKILILAMQPGCVELLSHPSSHMQELGLLLLHHPWCCCSFCGLFCVKSCLSFFFSKLVRNFWRRPQTQAKSSQHRRRRRRPRRARPARSDCRRVKSVDWISPREI